MLSELSSSLMQTMMLLIHAAVHGALVLLLICTAMLDVPATG